MSIFAKILPASVYDWMLHALVDTKLRAKIYHTVGRQLDSGIKLIDALETQYQIYSDQGRSPDQPAAIMLSEVKGLVEDGSSFADAMQGWATPLETALIAAGARSGQLSSVFKDAIHLLETQKGIRGTIVTKSLYPLILAIAIGVLFYVVSHRIVPAFSQTSPAENWEGAGRLMYLMSYFMDHMGVATAIFLALLLIGSIAALPHLTGNVRFYLDKVPPFSIYRRVTGSIFLLSLAVQIRAGVMTQDALELILANSNRYLRERVTAALQGTTKGDSLGVALLDSEYEFPDKETILQMVALDKLDDFDVAMRTFADEQLTDVLKKTVASMEAFNNAMVALNGLASAVVMLGAFDIQQSISSGF